MSLSGDFNRVVAAIAGKTDTNTSTGLALNTTYYIQFSNSQTEKDTHSSFGGLTTLGVTTTLANGSYWTTPVTGYYNFTFNSHLGSIPTSGNELLPASFILVDDVAFSTGNNNISSPISPGFSECGHNNGSIIYLIANQKIKFGIQLEQSGGSDTYNLRAWKFTISKVSGSTQVSASESVNCRYTSNSGQSFADSVSTTVVFEDKDFDSHGSYNSSTGDFTAPVSGVYSFQSVITPSSHTPSSIASRYNMLLTDSSNTSKTVMCDLMACQSTTAAVYTLTGVATQKLMAGEVRRIRIYHNSGSSLTANVDPNRCWMSIIKVGN